MLPCCSLASLISTSKSSRAAADRSTPMPPRKAAVQPASLPGLGLGLHDVSRSPKEQAIMPDLGNLLPEVSLQPPEELAPLATGRLRGPRGEGRRDLGHGLATCFSGNRIQGGRQATHNKLALAADTLQGQATFARRKSLKPIRTEINTSPSAKSHLEAPTINGQRLSESLEVATSDPPLVAGLPTVEEGNHLLQQSSNLSSP